MRIKTLAIVSIMMMGLGFSCNHSEPRQNQEQVPKSFVSLNEEPNPLVVDSAPENRYKILANLQSKIEIGVPLVAHVFVPLCDNENQGIVPVNSSLGNGQSTKTNLYWGAGYGIRTHFQRQKDWKSLALIKPKESWILERAIFKKYYPNGATVILIADAYDGAFMKQCLEDYFDALCSKKTGSIAIDSLEIPAWGDADLLAFNGHNGLMDVEIEGRKTLNGKEHDAVAIACASHSYFAPRLRDASAYPLVTTNNLLAPEAYVMRGIIDQWALLHTGEEVRFAAANAYNTYQKCGIKGASRLFHTDW